jgi:8-amino-7-oxononanoate synthase
MSDGDDVTDGDHVNWAELIAARLDSVRDAGRWRSIRTLDGGDISTVESRTGRAVTGFASNDYLGLSQHPAVIAAAITEAKRSGAGAGAARLIVGGRPVHDRLEVELASWTDRDAALLFPTGYQANVGVLGALASAAGERGGLICSDELNHASIIDGARLARAEVAVYPHNDLRRLDAMLDAADRPALVVTDSVFSMDGDPARLDDLAELCEHHGALLVVDEAHAVLGPRAPESAVIVGTLSKALGAQGGFVASSRDVIDLCTNVARAFIFTTALAPTSAAAALASLEILRSAEGDDLLARLRHNIDLIMPGHPSPIIPIILGAEDRAMAVAAALLEQGLLVPAIRPPTVGPGRCRLRIALSAAHSESQLLRLRAALDDLAVSVDGSLTDEAGNLG